jgi:hypothetical protein
MDVDGFIEAARYARSGPPSSLSPILLRHALREILACMLASGAAERGDEPLDIGSRILASIIADLEEQASEWQPPASAE